jgi:hypothetical protein
MTRLDRVDDFSSLVGYRFPGDDYRIAAHRHWLACDTIGAEPTQYTQVAHPLFVYYAAIGGMGMSLESFFELCGCGPDSPQPMLGETTLELQEPLHIGADYRVSGTIKEVKRREGRRTGVMDLITAGFEIATPKGDLRASCGMVFVFPRRAG